MYNAYFYQTTDMEEASRSFIENHFGSQMESCFLKELNCKDFLENRLLLQDCLDGEILLEDNKVVILTNKSIDNFDISSVINI